MRFCNIRIKFVERNSHRKKQRSVRWQLRFSLNDLSRNKLWLEENSPSRIAEKRKRQTRQKPFSLLHLTRARSHLPESDNANVCYVVSHNSLWNSGPREIARATIGERNRKKIS